MSADKPASAPPSRPYDPELDALLPYEAAMRAIGERVRAGAPPPTTGYFGRTGK